MNASPAKYQSDEGALRHFTKTWNKANNLRRQLNSPRSRSNDHRFDLKPLLQFLCTISKKSYDTTNAYT